MNNVALVGRAGNDPVVKTFSSGKKVAEVRIAINRPGGKDDKATDWFQVKFWGKSAEIAEQYLKKGHLFGVVGELQEEKWESNGEQRSKVVIVGRNLRLLQSKKDAQGEDGADIFGSSDEEMPF